MKVAIIANPFVSIPPEGYGGIESVIYYLIKGLKEAGHQPILLGTGDSRVDCPVIPIVPKAMNFPEDQEKLTDFRAEIDKINLHTRDILRELLPRVDIIHSHGFDISEFADFPHVFTIHNNIGFSPAATQKDRLLLEFPFNPDVRSFFESRKHLNYISISNNQRDPLPDLNYVATVYNGEDPSIFPIVTKPDDYVCFLGRFEPEKSPHLAIELALSQNIPIKLGGKVDFHGQDYFNSMIRPHLDNPLVEYVGELGFKEKVELLSKARCNLHPTSWREPFGLTIIEAAFCGTPTMAISRGSMPEIIQDGFTGKLVEDFLEGPHYLPETFRMNRNYIARRSRRLFSYKKMTRGYVKAYKKTIRHQKKSREEFVGRIAHA